MQKLDALAKFGCLVMTLLFGVAVLGNINIKSSNNNLRNELNVKSSEISIVNQKVEQLQLDYANLEIKVQELAK